jgi:hypothetical protein
MIKEVNIMAISKDTQAALIESGKNILTAALQAAVAAGVAAAAFEAQKHLGLVPQQTQAQLPAKR